jgi:hypothetical protein
MFTIFTKKNFLNKNLSDYCAQSMIKYIRRITETSKVKSQLMDKNKCEIITLPNHNNDDYNTNNVTNIVIFISISSMFYLFFNSMKYYQDKFKANI